jgi:hypothetical protein
MYKIEIEKADGEIRYWNDGKLFEDAEDAEMRTEFIWNLQSHTGEYASFRVVNAATGDVYSELEC